MSSDTFNSFYRLIVRKLDPKAKDLESIVSILPITDETTNLSLHIILSLLRKASSFKPPYDTTETVNCYRFVEDCLTFRIHSEENIDFILIPLQNSSNNLNKKPNPKIYEWEINALGILYVKDVLIKTIQVGNNPDLDKKVYELLFTMFDHTEPRIRNMTANTIPYFLLSPLSISQTLLDSILSRIQNGIRRTIESRETLLGSESSIPLDDTTGWHTLESDLLAIHNIILHLQKNPMGSDLIHKIEKDRNIVNIVITLCGTHINRHIRQATLTFIKSYCDAYKSGPLLLSYNSIMIQAMISVLSAGLEDDWSQIRKEAILASHSFLNVFIPSTLCDQFILSETSENDGASNTDNSNSHLSQEYREFISYSLETLLPKLCLSRFYVAEGVRSSAQAAWMSVVNSNGKLYLSKYIAHTSTFYCRMSMARNHMVAEAACHAITEATLKLDQSVTSPYIKNFISTLQNCILQDSWPVRDAACVSLGRIVKQYGELLRIDEIKVFIDQCLFRQLKDSIWSVRENAAIALGDLLECCSFQSILLQTDVSYQSNHSIIQKLSTWQEIREITRQSIINYLMENISKAKEEYLVETKKMSFIPPQVLSILLARSKALKQSTEEEKKEEKKKNNASIHSHSQVERINGENGVDWKKASGWGCCLDCIIEKPCHPWEESDGCIYLFREFSKVYPEQVLLPMDKFNNWKEFNEKGDDKLVTNNEQKKDNFVSCPSNCLLTKLFELLRVDDYKDASKLHCTIYEQLPEILEQMNRIIPVKQLVEIYKEIFTPDVILWYKKMTMNPYSGSNENKIETTRNFLYYLDKYISKEEIKVMFRISES